MTQVRINMLRGHMPYTVVQSGQMLYVMRAGVQTGEERYLPNGWEGVTDDIRQWLVDLGFSQIQ